MNFVHLHLHTDHSILDGLGRIPLYVQKAKELKMPFLAITDHGNIDGTINFYNECISNEIKPILGAELYIVNDVNIHDRKEERGHITLLAKNEIGWINLKKLITYSNIYGFYYKPRIDPDVLLKNCEGLIIMSACVGSFIRFEWGVDLLYKLNKEDTYLEIMPHCFEDQKKHNLKCLELSKDFELVATNDCHYINEDDAKSQEVLLAVQTKQKWNDPNRFKFVGGEYWMKDAFEMSTSFIKQDIIPTEIFARAISRTLLIANKCNLTLEKKNICLPKIIENVDEAEFLFEKIQKGLKDKIKETSEVYSKYLERAEFEFELIKKKGFIRYFLIVWELINWCKENNIMTGPGRGSSSGSLVCYLLGITQIDPIKYDLVFFRFIGIERSDIPDIDIDFEDIKRPLIKKHLEELYGEENVAGISTYSSMKGKSALRDVSRVFEIPLIDVNKICSVIESKIEGDEGSTETIKEAIENFEEGRAFYIKYPEIVEIAMKLEGTLRQRGMHAAAIVISEDSLSNGNSCSLVLGKDKEPMINWDKDNIEFVGLMKLDVLGLKMLTVFNYCKSLIKDELDFDSIPLTDKNCYQEFSKGNTVGCFQVGSQGLKKFCQQLGIDNFDMLMSVTSLYRPGPLRSGMADVFLQRKHGELSVSTQHPIIDKITKDTFGIILYQEQFMLLTNELAGFDWGEVEKLRKIVAKSKGVSALKEYEDKFVDGCMRMGTIYEEQARSLWNELVTFGAYSFNKSHACAYSVITYWGMWLKLNYPNEYICSLLTYGSDDSDRKNEYIAEAFRLGLDIRPPKIGISKAREWVLLNDVLYAPFIEIFGVGDKNADAFVKCYNNGFYTDGIISKRYEELLKKINAFEDKKVTDDKADEISEFLCFSLVKNKLRKYRKLKALLFDAFNFSSIKEINLNVVDNNSKYYFGIITKLNLSLKRGKEETYTSVTALFNDDTETTQLQFDYQFYLDNKEQIEQCEDTLILIKASCPKKPGSLIVNNALFQEDLFTANFKNFIVNIVKVGRFKNVDLVNCKDCELINEYNMPILPSMGVKPIMIISESPTFYDNKAGFILNNVDLWKKIKEFGLDRIDFHVTSFIKCYSPITITRKHIEVCSKWLKEELSEVKPYLILAFGNSALKFFLNEESGILAKSNTIEWNEQYGCWICWCVSPSSLIYSSENEDLFNMSIQKFCEKVKFFDIPF